MAESTLVRETVTGYEAFKKRIEELKKVEDKIVVLFTGSKSEDGRRSWCPDCNDFEDIFKSFKVKYNPSGFMLTVDVGNREQWKSKDSPFRTDRALRLTSIPTLMLWGTPKVLTSFDEPSIEMLFNEDD